MSVNLIIRRVQTLLSGVGSVDDIANPDYICRFLEIVNDDLMQRFENLDLNFSTEVVILPDVPANTTDLSSFQQEGAPLACLELPLLLEWRLAGQTQLEWQPVENVQKVYDTDTGTGLPGVPVTSEEIGIDSYEWRGGVIYISPSSQDTDIRVRYQSLPVDLDADSPNQPVRGVVNILAYGISIMILSKRGGQDTLKTDIEGWLTQAVGLFESTQVKSQQSQRQRLGSRRSQWNGGPGYFVPGNPLT
jgi:hypothetical protein